MDNTHKVLASLMRHNDHTQASVSLATGVNQPTISRILNPDAEKGIRNPGDKPVRALAEFYGITVDQMRGYSALDIDGLIIVPASPSAPETSVDDAVAWLTTVQSISNEEAKAMLFDILSMSGSGALDIEAIRLLHEMAIRAKVQESL